MTSFHELMCICRVTVTSMNTAMRCWCLAQCLKPAWTWNVLDLSTMVSTPSTPLAVLSTTLMSFVIRRLMEVAGLWVNFPCTFLIKLPILASFLRTECVCLWANKCSGKSFSSSVFHAISPNHFPFKSSSLQVSKLKRSPLMSQKNYHSLIVWTSQSVPYLTHFFVLNNICFVH